ncbi:hypothetical protein N7520_004560 [Penicillium odoratum]|uniref:uncharacterized protein n=1 Tax=Penicillium odoratum TaxID=1167516 RepID=UPI0025493C37|nr:uncharacterized protein N7520_004560 [Penicillium odoratum]KAJ5765001.1 hypothetical protein N7520_004560 [Penicillium odoratum]
MTATSSLLPSGMEIPAEDLEMASPYQGQADDFDIDIDLMEDQVSNMDSDMMGADDFPNTSQPSLFQNDVADDADMVDEASEGSMVDADNLPDEDHDIDVQYDDVTYEAEMLEGDHNETADVDVPTINVETTQTIENNDPSQIAPETATEPNTEGQEIQSLPPVTLPAETDQQETVIQEPQVLQETVPVEKDEKVQNEPVQAVESAEPIADNDNSEVGERTNETAESNIPGPEVQHTPDHSVENLENPKAAAPNADPTAVEHEEIHVSRETEHENTHEEESLHTVKVIYQDNEISLFPPLEGDSAETFFLHDEDVAYDNVSRLFSSLRDVLLDNIAEHDTLVIDIDSLGIQLTEDSSDTSRITLHQILDIYLRLCHNDGIYDPDALYLSLSSKPAVHHELASLDSAAKEGKGLSQIHLWADYDEEDPVVEDAHGTHEQSDDGLQRDSQGNQPGDGAVASQKTDLSDEGTHESDESNDMENVADEAHQGLDSSDAGIKTNTESRSTEAQHEQETNQRNDEHQDKLHGNESHTEEPDLGERPTTESAGSAVLSEPAVAIDQPEDASVEATHDGHEALEHHEANENNQRPGNEDLDDDEFSGADDLEVADLAVPAEQVDEQGHEDGTHSVDSTFQHDGEPTSGLEAVNHYDHVSEEAPEYNTDPNAYEESESTLENLPREDAERTPEPEDHLLEIAEDVLQTPAKEKKDDGNAHSVDSVDQEYLDDFAATSFAHGDDDEDYNYDYEFVPEEETELGGRDPSTDFHAPDNLSVKRSRDEDDEWDITEATTPELKRRRPS